MNHYSLAASSRISRKMFSPSRQRRGTCLPSTKTVGTARRPIREAARQSSEAGSYHDRVIAEAEGEAARFESLAAVYRRAPAETATRLYLETLEEVMPRLNINVVDSDNVELDLIKPNSN